MRALASLLCLFAALPAFAPNAFAPPAAAQPAPPPHAVLFGVWTGGLYPVLTTQIEQECRAEPSFAIRGDTIARASLIEPGLIERTITTVRVVPNGFEIQMAPTENGRGFGCETPDVLHVQRLGADQISFPGCADFPNPLVRCR